MSERSDATTVLSKVSGLPKADVRAIFEKAVANNRALASCVGPHAFEVIPGQTRPIAKRHRCTKCGGEAEANAVSWYNDGLKHGRQGT